MDVPVNLVFTVVGKILILKWCQWSLGTVLVKIEILVSTLGNLLNIVYRNAKEQQREWKTTGRLNPFRI